jgi:ATP-dependent DNA helicase RecQ
VTDRLADVAAFEALFARLAGGASRTFVAVDPAIERLRHAIDDPQASPLDIAVLMRHVLRAEAVRRGPGSRPRLPSPAGRALARAMLEYVGLAASGAGEIEALPWRPDWLDAADGRAVDETAAAAPPRRFGPDDLGPIVDPFLKSAGWKRYRSVGQRAAIRAALLVPPGETLAINLPTGEGKSLVFQTIDRVGFASDTLGGSGSREGVTLVVVPTVALAYDHEMACRRHPGEFLAYVGGGGAERREAVRDRIRNSQDGLCFAAPEAACLGLRSALRTAARAGRLKAIVIDEAHLVDAWGTGFRSEFQVLSGVRAELIALSPQDRVPRTILLSATMTPETLATLKVLFSDPGEFRLLSAAQVRPEPDYWVAQPCEEEGRRWRVDEALLRVPRPAILYVTRVADARSWGDRLRERGFRRIGVFHGETPDLERQRILDKWRRGDLDLVVATSAFGLGIDYPHVRTIVHACVPETFDRFYQEVGRAGRDGCAAVSIVIPTPADFQTARGLNRKRVIGIKRGLRRWSSMFEHPDRHHMTDMRFRLRLDIPPDWNPDDIDLLSERGTDWSARVLTLLARAGILRIVGRPEVEIPQDGSDLNNAGVFETVDILDANHLQKSCWITKVEPMRTAIADASRRNFDLMCRHLAGGDCPADLVAELYGADAVDLVCSSCGLCRSDGTAQRPTRLRREPATPWPGPPPASPLAALLDPEHRLVVTYDPRETGLSARRRAAELFHALWRYGIRSFAILGEVSALFERALGSLADVAAFVERPPSLAAARLPRGSLLVLVGPNGRLGSAALRPTADRPCLFLIPRDLPDPERPDAALLDRYPGSVIPLDNLFEKLSR